MEKLNDSNLKDLVERMVIKTLKEDLDDNQSVSTNSGTTVVNINQNNSILLLFYLYLMDKNNINTTNVEEHNNENDLEEILQKVHDLQQKNKQFHQEIHEQINQENE